MTYLKIIWLFNLNELTNKTPISIVTWFILINIKKIGYLFEGWGTTFSALSLASDQFDTTDQTLGTQTTDCWLNAMESPVFAHTLNEMPGLHSFLLNEFGVFFSQFELVKKSVVLPLYLSIDRLCISEGNHSRQQSNNQLSC